MPVADPQEEIKTIREKIRANKELMLKTPSYNTARDIQKYIRELNAAVAEYRSKNIKIVYNYEDSLLEKLVA